MKDPKENVYIVRNLEDKMIQKANGSYLYTSYGAALNRCPKSGYVVEYKLVPTGRVLNVDGNEVPNDSTIQE